MAARAPGSPRARQSQRLDRQDWVSAALRTLHEEGVDQVRVERLAKALGVTKGSFYWHFRDRQDLLDKMLAYWFERMTQTVFDVANRFRGEPQERLLAVLEDITGHDRAGYDLAVRAWARNDASAAAAVRDIDQRRCDFLVQLFRDIGFDDDEAALRGRITYCFVLGEAMAFNRQGRDEALHTIRRKVALLVSGEPPG